MACTCQHGVCELHPVYTVEKIADYWRVLRNRKLVSTWNTKREADVDRRGRERHA
jgi:hypothetical protein